MKRYFFDVFDGRELVEDVEGQKISGASALLQEAEEIARELIAIITHRGDHLSGRELKGSRYFWPRRAHPEFG